jgi:hypothetical protein
MSEIAIYEDGSVVIDATVENETIWLSQKQLCELFGRDKSVISRHIRNIFKEGELDPEATVAKNATVQTEGERRVNRTIEYYNLDLIISVGYRVNSKQATHFRQWATGVLKQYLIHGYALDRKRLQKQKLTEQFAESRRLEEEIRKNLGALGYEL